MKNFLRSAFAAGLLAFIAYATLTAGPAFGVVSAVPPTITYTGNGTTTLFTVPFNFQHASDLVLTKHAPGAGGGTTVTLALGTDYTVQGVGSSYGGAVALAVALPSGNTLTIIRLVGETQPFSFRSQSYYNPALHEQAFDWLEYQVQQVTAAQADGGSFGGTATSLAPGALIANEPIIGDGSSGNHLAFDYSYSGTFTSPQAFTPSSGVPVAARGSGSSIGLSVSGGPTSAEAGIFFAGSTGIGLVAVGGTTSGDGVHGVATANGVGGAFTGAANQSGVTGTGGTNGGPGGVFTGGVDGGLGIVAVGGEYVSGNLNVDGGVFIRGIRGEAGEVALAVAAVGEGSAASLNGDVAINGVLTVDTDSEFEEGLAVGGWLYAASDAGIEGSLRVGGSTFINGNLSVDGGGVFAAGANGVAIYAAGNVNVDGGMTVSKGVVANNPADGATVITANAYENGTAIVANGGSAGRVLVAIGADSISGDVAAPAVQIIGSKAGGTGDGSGTGLFVTGGTDDGIGGAGIAIDAYGGVAGAAEGGIAIRAEGTGAAAGIYARGGPTGDGADLSAGATGGYAASLSVANVANAPLFIQPSAAPSTAVHKGDIYFDSSANAPKFSNGSSFVQIPGLSTANTWTGLQTFSGGINATGSSSIDFSGSSGLFKTSTGATTVGGSGGGVSIAGTSNTFSAAGWTSNFPNFITLTSSSPGLTVTNITTGSGSAIVASIAGGGSTANAAGSFSTSGTGVAVYAAGSTSRSALALAPQTAPSAATTPGDVYFDATEKSMAYSDGTAFRFVPKCGHGSLSSGLPSTLTVTVPSGSTACIATEATTQTTSLKCVCSSTTCIITGPNTVSDAVNFCYW